MIIATTTDYGCDEDSESCGRVTRTLIDNFMRRPSVEDRAINALATIANNDLSMLSTSAEHQPMCDAAFVMVDRRRVRFLISGTSVAYHFEGGLLAHRSLPGEADVLGSGPRYAPRLEEPFDLRQVDNAFLTASPAFARCVTDEQVGSALRESKTPEEWMERLRALAGDVQFCAVAAFPPKNTHSLLQVLKGGMHRDRNR